MIALIFLVATNPFFWKPQTIVRVYFIGFTQSQKLAVMRGVESWQGVPVRFVLASEVMEIQTCQDCLTLRRAKSRKGEHATQHVAYNAISGWIKYAWIDTEAQDLKAIESIMAHEVGHMLSLPDCSCDSVMGKLGGMNGWRLPNQRDLELVRVYYLQLASAGK